MEQIAEAISHAVSRQNQLVLDPFAAALVIVIVLTYFVMRATGKRKSTRQRIEDMEDADFPVDDVEPGARETRRAESRPAPEGAEDRKRRP